MQKIGFLSFGHWQPIPGSQTRTARDALVQTIELAVAAEEIGVDIAGVALTYVESGYFTSDDGDPVINIVFTGPLPAQAQPFAASPEEVAEIVWLTTAEAEVDSACPPWTLRALRHAGSAI